MQYVEGRYIVLSYECITRDYSDYISDYENDCFGKMEYEISEILSWNPLHRCGKPNWTEYTELTLDGSDWECVLSFYQNIDWELKNVMKKYHCFIQCVDNIGGDFAKDYSNYISDYENNHFSKIEYNLNGNLSWKPETFHRHWMPLLSWREYAELTLDGSEQERVFSCYRDTDWELKSAVEKYHYFIQCVGNQLVHTNFSDQICNYGILRFMERFYIHICPTLSFLGSLQKCRTKSKRWSISWKVYLTDAEQSIVKEK